MGVIAALRMTGSFVNEHSTVIGPEDVFDFDVTITLTKSVVLGLTFNVKFHWPISAISGMMIRVDLTAGSGMGLSKTVPLGDTTEKFSK